MEKLYLNLGRSWWDTNKVASRSTHKLRKLQKGLDFMQTWYEAGA
jgi:hypothetical protein